MENNKTIKKGSRPKFTFLKEPKKLRNKPQSNYIYDSLKNIQNKFNRLGTNNICTLRKTKYC